MSKISKACSVFFSSLHSGLVASSKFGAYSLFIQRLKPLIGFFCPAIEPETRVRTKDRTFDGSISSFMGFMRSVLLRWITKGDLRTFVLHVEIFSPEFLRLRHDRVSNKRLVAGDGTKKKKWKKKGREEEKQKGDRWEREREGKEEKTMSPCYFRWMYK